MLYSRVPIGNPTFTVKDSLSPALSQLALLFPREVKVSLSTIAKDFLDICNNWEPKCPVDTGRLISSSAVFVDGRLVGKGKISNSRDIDSFMGRHTLKTFNDLANFQDYNAVDYVPDTFGQTLPVGATSNLEVTVAYFSPYAIIQHEGISPLTGEQYHVYTREGSGPKFVEAKFTLYKRDLENLIQSAVQDAFGRF